MVSSIHRFETSPNNIDYIYSPFLTSLDHTYNCPENGDCPYCPCSAVDPVNCLSCSSKFLCPINSHHLMTMFDKQRWQGNTLAFERWWTLLRYLFLRSRKVSCVNRKVGYLRRWRRFDWRTTPQKNCNSLIKCRWRSLSLEVWHGTGNALWMSQSQQYLNHPSNDHR